MSREQMIAKGLIVPVSFYLSLSRDNPKRIAWEYKAIIRGD